MPKCFIWQCADETTDNFHPEAGVVIFAETLEQAREKAAQDSAIQKASEVFTKDPDHVFEQFDGVFVFPDKGCC